MNEVSILKALADPTRLKILECLKNGERCICEIIPYTGKSQPNVSQHLKVLKNAGLVDERREGTRILLKVSTKKIFDVITSVKHLQ
jgi:ArsR family transcriptional regulator